ncbi:hypothetical protein D770_20435 [Flammeovirgaceae bacterium 311]|nr:hypothetical protein D770_20435 [Flammeovirgaceae bacterium 311]
MSIANKVFAEQRMHAWLAARRMQCESEIAVGYSQAEQELEAIALIEQHLEEMKEQQRKINRYRRLLTICKETVSELLNDQEL